MVKNKTKINKMGVRKTLNSIRRTNSSLKYLTDIPKEKPNRLYTRYWANRTKEESEEWIKKKELMKNLKT